MYNVILFSDTPSDPFLISRGAGVYRIASELRIKGYSVLVVDYCSFITMEQYHEILDIAIGDNTKIVGFSTSWFPLRNRLVGNPRQIIITNKDVVDDRQPHPVRDEWYRNSIAYHFTNYDINDFIKPIRDKNDKIKIIIGGTKVYQYTEESVFDAIFIGFSDSQIIDYVDALEKGEESKFPKIINHDTKAWKFDFKSCKTTYVEENFIHPREILTIEFSRGCIFNCTFCSYPHRNQKTKEFNRYQEVLREELLENWERWRIDRYTITDDTFNDYTEKLILIRDVIVSLPFKPKFWAYIRYDIVAQNPEQLDLLREIGVMDTFYGMETFNDSTAKIIRKGLPTQKKLDAIKFAKAKWGDDVKVVIGLIVGLPHDTIQDCQNIMDWYIKEGHTYVDMLSMHELWLRPSNPYQFQSEMELNMEKYGYKLLDPETFYWERSGPGDIWNTEIAREWSLKVRKAAEPYYNYRPRTFNTEDLLESFKYKEDDTLIQKIYNFATDYYVKQLMEFLKNKKIR